MSLNNKLLNVSKTKLSRLKENNFASFFSAARQNRREPRANNAPRRGPRNERAEKGDNDRQAANQEGGARPPRRQGDGERRRGGPRREKDRQSGDPKTSVKGREKRGGAGSRNWGKPGDEQWEQVSTFQN